MDRLRVLTAAAVLAGCTAAPGPKPVPSPVAFGEGVLGRLAFVSKDSASAGGVFRLNLVEKGQQQPVVLAESRQPLMSPAWSPDGSRVAFVGYEQGVPALFVQAAATGQLRRVVQGQNVGAPCWSPDGSKLALSLSTENNPDIHVLVLATGALQRITRAPGIETSPAWSPDGMRIAFTSDRSGKPLIYEATVDGTADWKPLVQGVQGAFDPSYSPDGRALLYTVNAGGRYFIEMVDLQSKARTRLSEGPRDEAAGFSPDGQFVVYESQRDEATSLEVRALDGSVRQTLRSREELRQPTWVATP